MASQENVDAFITTKLDSSNRALWTAASSGDTKQIDRLLSNGAKPDAVLETFDYTPLMAASFRGHYDAAKMLINNGADVNRATIYGNTALMSAAVNGQQEVVELLLQRQAHVNAKIGQTGYTALMFAAENGHDEIVDLLLGYGADVRIANVDGKTATDFAYNKRIRTRLLEAERYFY